MEKLIDETILNLKILSNIKKNDKLITNTNILEIDNPNILQGLNRWYYNENRELTVKKLNQICENTFKITDYILSNEKDKNITNQKNVLQYNNNELFQLLIIEMTNSLNGLNNLKDTYVKDISISSQIDILKKKITMKIEKLNKLFSLNINNYY